MNVFVKLKSAGKRRPILADTPYALPNTIASLRQLLEAVVTQEVEAYNRRGFDTRLVNFLTETDIEEQSATGKVGFGRLYSERKAALPKAIETALLGFEDGLFRVLVGEQEIAELDAPLTIREGDVLTFIRLTFLAGRLW
jgi:hypothetical protein